ncbi:hypothetical protein PUMCH_003744 [Australozyma saopauloensis]|uniref:Cysteine protease n=1 Tax=Australozyma saopauloensis TaxID=291208 RepID=A0AAX4HD99_9ASCO|nr:hypothetical protein PUMCH_003744 [[Candida] saopauloensis]
MDQPSSPSPGPITSEYIKTASASEVPVENFPEVPTGEALFEAQLTHIQETITQWWQKLKEQPQLEPTTVVILGKVLENERLESQAVADSIGQRIWCTYRCGFEPIPKAQNGPAPLLFITSILLNSVSARSLFGGFDNQLFHTDVGWGCMIRTSQSLLANTFQRVVEKSGGIGKEAEIIKLFGDTYESTFSLHNFVRAASQLPLEVKPGEWFGPSAASLSIKRLCDKYSCDNLPSLRVHVSENSALCDGEIEALFADKSDALLVLFPIRLGIETVNIYYYPSILELLALPQSVGIAGGKPSSSYYFVGYLGDNLLYLDPHNLQPVSADLELYHTSRCQTIPISSLDPLMLVGILLHDIEDYKSFKGSIADSNKIISFHDKPVKKSIAGDDYIRINAQLGMSTIDDYVDVSDQFSGENLLLHDESESEINITEEIRQDDSFENIDAVEHSA